MVEGPILHHLDLMMASSMVTAPILHQAIQVQAKRVPAVMGGGIPHRLVTKAPVLHNLDMALAAVALQAMAPTHRAA